MPGREVPGVRCARRSMAERERRAFTGAMMVRAGRAEIHGCYL